MKYTVWHHNLGVPLYQQLLM